LGFPSVITFVFARGIAQPHQHGVSAEPLMTLGNPTGENKAMMLGIPKGGEFWSRSKQTILLATIQMLMNLCCKLVNTGRMLIRSGCQHCYDLTYACLLRVIITEQTGAT